MHRFDADLAVVDLTQRLREAVQHVTQHEVVQDRGLVDRLLEVDAEHQVIRVQPGLPLRHHYRVLSLATRYVIGGLAWAPEFLIRPKLVLVPPPREG